MFTAISADGSGRVTTLDPAWFGRSEELRALAEAKAVLCPGCLGGLRYRAGELLRPHFAHRVLSDCPLEKQSAEVLEGKAKLYLWLQSKFPGQVEMDIDLKIPRWDKPADVVVRPSEGLQLAYWVFDRGPRHRAGLRADLPPGIERQVIFTESALKHEVTAPDCLVLTAAHRDFISATRFDVHYYGDGHLHFLDTRTGRLSIYWGLDCVHAPSIFAFDKISEGDLTAALVSPKTGEIVFQQDVDDLVAWEKLSGEDADDDEEDEEDDEEEDDSGAAPQASPQEVVREEREEAVAVVDLNAPLRCEKCGTLTKNWVTAVPGKGTCVCRPCFSKRP